MILVFSIFLGGVLTTEEVWSLSESIDVCLALPVGFSIILSATVDCAPLISGGGVKGKETVSSAEMVGDSPSASSRSRP